MADDSYDVIVIGAGPTGENAADRAVRGGLSADEFRHDDDGGQPATHRPVACILSGGPGPPHDHVAPVNSHARLRLTSGLFEP